MNNKLRLAEESLDTYALRLYDNKSEYNIDSQEIADLLNKETGKNFGESAWRKKYANVKRGIEYAKKNFLNSSEELNALEEKKREIIAARDNLSIVRREYNAVVKKKSRQELFYEQIAEEIKTLNVPEFIPAAVNADNEKDYILTLADIHAGSCFDIGKNKYSFEIITKRFNYLLSKTIDFCHINNVSHINVLCLSDTVQGILRKSDLKLNESSVVKAVVFIQKTISNFLNALSECVFVDYYHCPTGNHTQTRPLGSDRNELKDEDVEFIIGNYIFDVLKFNQRVNVHITGEDDKRDYVEFECAGNNIIAMHGHTIKNTNTAIKDISFHNRKFYDVLFLAHFHGASYDVNGADDNKDIETYVVPSFIGTCPYADGLMKASKPSCMIYTLSDEGVVGTNKIILKDGDSYGN